MAHSISAILPTFNIVDDPQYQIYNVRSPSGYQKGITSNLRKESTMPSCRWSPPPWIVLLLPTLFLSGCISVADLSHNALKYNEAVEQAQNRMLFLNVVRAEGFRPMYITDLTKITGSIKLDLNSGGLESDYGPYYNSLLKGTGSLTSGKLTPSVDYVQNPTFDVNVLSSQEFMKGFTSPCTKDLLAYYWEQGWPPEFLLYLFVHDVDVDDGHGKKEHYENYPDPFDRKLQKLERFGEWVTDFVKKKPRFVQRNVSIGPCLDPTAGNLNALVEATKEGLSVTQVKGGWRLEQQKADMILMLPDQAVTYEANKKNATCESSPDENTGLTFHLRSPEGILFYLGELARVEENFNKFPSVCVGEKLWPLFVVLGKPSDKPEPTCKDVVLTVKYEGKESVIPDQHQEGTESAICQGLEIRPDGIDRSMPHKPGAKEAPQKIIEGANLNCFGGMSTEAFSLLTQLIALQKSAKDTPTTSVVRAIVQ
jgi:hypothetical protein